MAADPQGGHGTTNAGNAGTPAPPAAQLPGFNQRQWFAVALLKAIGAPDTPQNIAFVVAWSLHESAGGGGANNPLNTTESSGAPGETNFNSIGVKNFPDFNTGVAATAKNLQLPYYTNIVAALRSGNPEGAFTATDEFGTFSGGDGAAYANAVRSLYQQQLNDPNAAANVPIPGASSGGGTGGAPAAGASARGVPASILSQYGYLINDPEVGPILRAAANNPNLDLSQFQLELQGTTWWKTHSSTARQWINLQSTDPATYQQEMAQNAHTVIDAARNLGVTLNAYQIGAYADQLGRFGWSPQELTNALLQGFHPADLGQVGGQLGTGEQTVRATAADYGINLNDQQAFNYSKTFAEGSDPNAVKSTFANMAKALYPHLSQQLDQGLTLRDIASPYITQAANLLEVDPNSISLTDPKFTTPLSVGEGPKTRLMTQQEWGTTLMSNPAYGWQHTTNARDTAVNLVQSLGQTFGNAA